MIDRRPTLIPWLLFAALLTTMPLQASGSPADDDAAASAADVDAEAAADADDEQADAPLLPALKVEVPPQAARSKSTSFIAGDDMEIQHAQNMNDYLFSMTPGVTVARRSNLGFMGNNSGFYIRGLRGERVAVFVDGIPSQVNNHFHPLVDQYTPDMLERIEITRGTSGVLHGASAAGGVIDIFTRTPDAGLSGYLRGLAGRFDTRELQASVGYGWDGGSFQISTTDRVTDGHRPNLEFEANTLNLQLRQRLSPDWTFGAKAARTEAEIENPGPITSPSLARSTQDPTNFALTLDRSTASSTSLAAVYWNRATVDALRNGRGLPQGFRRFDERETGVRLKHAWLKGSGNTLTVGLDAVEYTDERTNGAGTVPPIENKESFASPYFQITRNLGDKTSFDAGVRLTTSSQFGTDVSPEVGVTRVLRPDLVLRARAGKGFRVPRVNDVNAPFAVPNPDLEPEDFLNFEVGLNKTFGRGSEFDVAVWQMEGDNLIQTIGGGGNARQVNTGEFSHSGLESRLDLRVSDRFNLRFGLGLADLENDTAQVPETTLDFGFDCRLDKWRFGLTGRHASDLYGGNNRTRPLPDYTVADLHVGFQVLETLELAVDVDNVTDEEYQTIAGYPQVPRAAFFSVRWGFETVRVP